MRRGTQVSQLFKIQLRERHSNSLNYIQRGPSISVSATPKPLYTTAVPRHEQHHFSIRIHASPSTHLKRCGYLTSAFAAACAHPSPPSKMAAQRSS
eukprot:SAG11_NODE_1467_length_4850_cov_7.452957_1_plen_96_part_00